eukprot:TRINITY_DN317_c0_g1_i1.p1 TRINITY_DN317_c0_g1~~TRINITY_DN317_c0_g1_i1.p1  ORF type:complete len:700 (-),score=100.41 TRINITY_DN317_c0_g1_i1:53-2152(-)
MLRVAASRAPLSRAFHTSSLLFTSPDPGNRNGMNSPPEQNPGLLKKLWQRLPFGFATKAAGAKPILKTGGSPPNLPTPRISNTALALFGLATVAYLHMRFSLPAPEQINWQMLNQYITANEVAEIVARLDGGRAEVHLVNSLPSDPSVYVDLGTPEAFEATVEHLQKGLGRDKSEYVPILYAAPLSLGPWVRLAFNVALVGAVVAIIKKSANSSDIQSSLLGNSKKTFAVVPAAECKTSFKDVAGLAEAKQEILELVDFLKNPTSYNAIGARLPKGAMLVGPPGVGKTLLAKATAGEAGVPFVSVAGSDFVEVFGGMGSRRVRELFELARKNAPCIVFIDEIDAIGKQRNTGGGLGRNDERESTLNALLVEMDGFNTQHGIVVLAGTNRSDVLDKALTRPGRFDRQIALDNPPQSDRKEIFLVHLSGLTIDPTLTKEELAEKLSVLTPGFSGADIMNVCNEAALIAARESAEHITLLHFDKAVERVIGGLEKSPDSSGVSQWERKVIAHHEAGHAVVGWFLQHSEPLLKVSIKPRGKALGFAQYLPKDRFIVTREQLFDRMCLALGGRVAEKLIFNHLSSGAADDLRRVTDMAYKQVSQFGMDTSIGHLSFPPPDSDTFTASKPYSRATEAKIDNAARELVTQAYSRTEELLAEKKELLVSLAQRLLERESLKGDELIEILGARPESAADTDLSPQLPH